MSNTAALLRFVNLNSPRLKVHNMLQLLYPFTIRLLPLSNALPNLW